MNKEIFQTLAILTGILITMLFLVVYFLVLQILKVKELEKRIDDLDLKMVGFYIKLQQLIEKFN